MHPCRGWAPFPEAVFPFFIFPLAPFMHLKSCITSQLVFIVILSQLSAQTNLNKSLKKKKISPKVLENKASKQEWTLLSWNNVCPEVPLSTPPVLSQPPETALMSLCWAPPQSRWNLVSQSSVFMCFFPVMECEIRACGRNASNYRVEGSGGYIGGELCRIVSKAFVTMLLSCPVFVPGDS